jgi:hypothetical protein
MARAGRSHDVHPNALLPILCAATFMSSLDLFIVNVGLRAIGESSLANLSWILNGYAIVFAALLVPAGRLADRYGNKQAFQFGLAVFSLASLGCALSSDLWLIVGLRIATAWFVVRSVRHDAPVVHLHLFRNREFTWASVAMVLVSVAFGTQLLGLVLWLQEGWGWSALQTGLGIAPGPAMVSVTAIGLRRYTASLPAGLVAAVGTLLLGAGGVLIGVTLRADANYAAKVLPGWMIIGAGVGLALPTIVAAGTAGLAPHQTSTGSAVVQMGRQIGSVLGVAALVVVLGSSVGSAGDLDRFTEAWWWAGLFALLAAVAALAITPRRRAGTEPAPAAG